MADNYLENKMAEFREGRTVVRRPSASLESLLNAVAGSGRVTPPQADHFVAPPVSDGPLPLHPRADMASGGETLPEHLTGGSTPSNTPAAPGLPTSPDGSVPASAVRPEDRREPIMPAQVQAVLRAGTIIKESESFRYETDEKEGMIRVLGPTSPRRYLLEAGEVIMAMRLKATELHLQCAVEYRPESTTPANPLIATLKLYK